MIPFILKAFLELIEGSPFIIVWAIPLVLILATLFDSKIFGIAERKWVANFCNGLFLSHVALSRLQFETV